MLNDTSICSVNNFLTMLFGCLVGGIVTFCVSKYYYSKASKDLLKESAELRRLTKMILHALEVAGFVEINRDENGEPSGFLFKMGLHIESSTKFSVNPTVGNIESDEQK